MSKLKIVSWNCYCGFDGTKVEVAKTFGADILVVPECREMDMDGSGYPKSQRDWYGDGVEAKDAGDNPERNLGIGVFWKNSVKVQPLIEPLWGNKTVPYRYVLPYRVSLPNGKSFTLFAVWTKDQKHGLYHYDDNVFQAVKAPEYKSLIADGAVLIGDFNTFAKSGNDDYKRLCDNLPGFSDAITKKSETPAATYHHGGGNFGADDFCFVSDSFAGKIVNAKVDNSWDKTQDKCCWLGGLSDHCPIIVELELRD
jgi:hypothetical protein